jgi:non-ribosomal peptide synthetase-like protein
MSSISKFKSGYLSVPRNANEYSVRYSRSASKRAARVATSTVATSRSAARVRLDDLAVVLRPDWSRQEKPTCLHEIFERQASNSPNAAALEGVDRSLTYAELDAEANRMARYLRSLGVARGSFVGISLDRSEWPIISILAILKAGGAYVPIEPSLPDARIEYIVEEAELTIVVTDERNEPRINKICGSQTVSIEDYCTIASAYTDTKLPLSEASATVGDVCYTLFTSGTTGRPKGVVTEHRNAVHFVGAFNEVCTTTPKDRVFQGFALGFDGSVEEIWMAFSNGAVLVCGNPETPRFGADLGQLLSERQISFFSTVPTLLSTLTEDLPELRQLVVSGEACHPDLVDRWANPGRTMLNVYGPTEATVNTTASILEKGKPVTIGRPLPGYDLYILDDELRPVKDGEKGELYVGGPGISRGYLNQPEQTASAYIDWTPIHTTAMAHPSEMRRLRLYKTGDLVRWNEDLELEFFGRIDSQVKLRGFRVELSEIEAVILEHKDVSAATVRVCDNHGIEALAAYVLLTDGANSLDRSQILETLRDRLPIYMIPNFLDVMEEFPRLASGKVDRKRLSSPKDPLVTEIEETEDELSQLETKIASVWAKQFSIAKVGVDQDFFTELGGHSLLAAQVVSALYEKLNFNVSVRDIYLYPTVRGLADELAKSMPNEAEANSNSAQDVPVAQNALPKWTWATISIQVIYFLSIVPLLALPMIYLIPLGIETLQNQSSVLGLAALGLAVVFGTWAALILIAILAKWLIIGKYRPGRYPLWGAYYIRWWIASRLQHLSFISAFNGTPFAPVIWRAMGAKVGHGCMLNASLVYAWDCIKLGDDVSIGVDTQLSGLRIEDGHLIIGDVEVGDRCFIGCHSALGLNVKMEADARLDDQSLLPDGFVASSGVHYRGSPPEAAEVPVPEGALIRKSRLSLVAFGIVQLIANTAITLLTLAPVVFASWLASILVMHSPATVSIPAFLALVPATMIVFAFWSALVKKLVDPKPRPGIYEVYSMAYLQHSLADLVMQIIKIVGLPVFTTIYLQPWMRLLGARLGKNTEMSTVWRINPDMVSAGDGVFFADGCMLGSSRTHLGRFETALNEIGNNSFIGNGAILSTGNCIGDNCLLGVLSATPSQTEAIPDNTDWLGSPGFRLPNRQKVSDFDQTLTYKPTWKLYLQRAMIDGLRVVLPGYILGGFAIISLLIVLAIYEEYGVWGAYTAIPLLTWLAIIFCLGTVVGLKWLIMGRYKPVIVPLWNSYVWWNELINGLYESLMSPWVSNLFGTPFAAILLRTLGCKIGKYCYIETDLFSEFDLVNIGDFVSLNAGVVVQNHLFEDRVMKSSRVTIGEGCSVGNMSVVLYDSNMEKGAVLGPMSLLMKGEMMPQHCHWHGIPTSRT